MKRKSTEFLTKNFIRKVKGKRIFLTNGDSKVVNFAIITEVVPFTNDNEMILEINSGINGLILISNNIKYKISYEIVHTEISYDMLNTCYMLSDDFDVDFEIFELTTLKRRVKSVRKSNSGGMFLNWYSDKRVTTEKISFYDGIYIGGVYIRVFNSNIELSDYLFYTFNNDKIFSSFGGYKGYITINGIVILDAMQIISINNKEINYTNKFGVNKILDNIEYQEEVEIAV
jgi:hypothetical protein